MMVCTIFYCTVLKYMISYHIVYIMFPCMILNQIIIYCYDIILYHILFCYSMFCYNIVYHVVDFVYDINIMLYFYIIFHGLVICCIALCYITSKSGIPDYTA